MCLNRLNTTWIDHTKLIAKSTPFALFQGLVPKRWAFVSEQAAALDLFEDDGQPPLEEMTEELKAISTEDFKKDFKLFLDFKLLRIAGDSTRNVFHHASRLLGESWVLSCHVCLMWCEVTSYGAS